MFIGTSLSSIMAVEEGLCIQSRIDVCAQSLRGQNLKLNGSRCPTSGHATPDKKAGLAGHLLIATRDSDKRTLSFSRHQKAAALAPRPSELLFALCLSLIQLPRHIWNLQVRKLLAIDSSSPLLAAPDFSVISSSISGR